jgi:hypothetical protein
MIERVLTRVSLSAHVLKEDDHRTSFLQNKKDIYRGGMREKFKIKIK